MMDTQSPQEPAMRQPMGCGSKRRWLSMLLSVFVASALSSGEARAKSGGGFHLGGEMGTDAAGYADRHLLLGGEGVKYMGPKLRLEAGLEAALGSLSGNGVRGGLGAGFVLAQIANADVFVGAGMGLAGGSSYYGVGLYLRPELGCQWNLGRTAVVAKLQGDLVSSLELGGAGRYFGLNVGLLFGDFSPQRIRRPRPGPPPPPPRRPGPARRPPPPPPRR